MVMVIANHRFDYVQEDINTSWSEFIIDFVHSKEKLLTNPKLINGDNLGREAAKAVNSSQIDPTYFKISHYSYYYGRIFSLIKLKDSSSKSCQFKVKDCSLNLKKIKDDGNMNGLSLELQF